MGIAANNVVTMHYTLTVEGDVVDSSEGRDPLTYLHGHGNIIPGLEAELVGKEPGDKVDAAIPPASGYGEYDEELQIAVPLDAFGDTDRSQLQSGVQFQGPHPSKEQPVVYTIVDVDDSQVLANGNHPLAGKTLNFAVEVVDVRDATEEEISHGHVHGPGGHQH